MCEAGTMRLTNLEVVSGNGRALEVRVKPNCSKTNQIKFRQDIGASEFTYRSVIMLVVDGERGRGLLGGRARPLHTDVADSVCCCR